MILRLLGFLHLNHAHHSISANYVAVIFDIVVLLRQVSGLPTPEIEWLINGKQVLQDSLRKVLVRETNVHSLLLERVSPMDEGQYTIKASNKAGSVITHVQLHVKGKKCAFFPNKSAILICFCVYSYTVVKKRKNDGQR